MLIMLSKIQIVLTKIYCTNWKRDNYCGFNFSIEVNNTVRIYLYSFQVNLSQVTNVSKQFFEENQFMWYLGLNTRNTITWHYVSVINPI